MLLSVATGTKHLLDYMEICAGRDPELDRRNPEQNINSLSENATAIIEHLYDVFYGRTCGGLLTQISGSNENHTVTLIAHVSRKASLSGPQAGSQHRRDRGQHLLH